MYHLKTIKFIDTFANKVASVQIHQSVGFSHFVIGGFVLGKGVDAQMFCHQIQLLFS